MLEQNRSNFSCLFLKSKMLKTDTLVIMLHLEKASEASDKILVVL